MTIASWFQNWNLITLWKTRKTRSAGSGFGTAVDQVVRDLEDLNGSTERDFLAVGEELITFRTTSRQLASDMAALTELISGEHGRRASGALTEILEQVKEIDSRIERSGAALEEVRDHSDRIRLAFVGLRNTVSVFRTLCTLTRIETSRLKSTGAGLADLAAEVMPLSESIQASGEGILEASSRLIEGVQSAIQRGSDLRARQLRELPALVSGIMESLQSWEERQRRAAESSVRHASQYEALCEAVGDVVRSIQFHDITRQQVEHVVQALRQLRGGRQKGGAAANALPPGAGAVLTLQSSQLSGAAGVFAASTGRMERDLETIAGRVQDMAEVSRALMGISADEQDSFFLRMEAQFTATLKTLHTCTAAHAEMASSGANLADTIEKMRAAITEIRGIEIRIQRIATNATIRATHLGGAGNALSVIADEMQHLALDSGANTEDVAGALDAMGDAAGRVGRIRSEAAFGAGPGQREVSEVNEEMRRTVLDLHASSECAFSRVSQIAEVGARLVQEIGAVRAGFSAGARFAEVVAGARGELDRIAAAIGEGPSDGCKVPQGLDLEGLSSRYTMQMERDVHESAARGKAMAVAPAGVPEAALEEGDLGENVELF